MDANQGTQFNWVAWHTRRHFRSAETRDIGRLYSEEHLSKLPRSRPNAQVAQKWSVFERNDSGRREPVYGPGNANPP
jgi:hypothetical protein